MVGGVIWVVVLPFTTSNVGVFLGVVSWGHCRRRASLPGGIMCGRVAFFPASSVVLALASNRLGTFSSIVGSYVLSVWWHFCGGAPLAMAFHWEQVES